jgi:UrcA family protein
MLTSKLASFAGLVGAAMIAIAPGASTAFAATPDDQVSVKVSIADLNMNGEAGARVALSRIRYAAEEICRGGIDEQTLGEQMQSRSCETATVERTVASMNVPALTAVSHGHHVTAMASR